MADLREVTTPDFKCGDTLSCPAVYRFADGRYAVRGTVFERIDDEAIIVVDPKMIAAAVAAEEGGAK
jgi:hypothetical protein